MPAAHTLTGRNRTRPGDYDKSDFKWLLAVLLSSYGCHHYESSAQVCPGDDIDALQLVLAYCCN